jgi:hypothetical protein
VDLRLPTAQFPHVATNRPLPRSIVGRPLRLVAVSALIVASGMVVAGPANAAIGFEVPSLDGSGNNVAHPDWGRVGTNYSRVVPARYADGVGSQVPAPNPRYISNRIFNDGHQNLFSERGVTQWGFVWGQFLDHTFGLRQAPGVGDSPDPSSRNIPFNPADPLEEFENTSGPSLDIPFTRSSIAPGTGVTSPREQVNTVSSYIDAWAVYGGTTDRLEWMREGPYDGNMANNGARLLMPSQLLPRRDSRGNPAAAPPMDIDGRLRATPDRATVAGDVRANENIGLTATHTLFAREHNRIVGLLPRSLSEEEKFQIARRIVMAEQQYITYTEFLPAMGIRLPSYRGYRSDVNANLLNEFATVAYRAHSQIHGEFEIEAETSRYTPAQLAALEAMGVEVAVDGDDVELAIPLNVAFFNPDLLTQVQLGPMLHGIGLEAQYDNDEQIDNQLRSVLFQIPVPGNPDCLDGEELPDCFTSVVDLGAIDIERGFDHGMPSYNQLRQAFGLAPKTSFTAITGEATDRFPLDPQLTRGNEINDPDSIDFVQVRDAFDLPVDPADEDAIEGTGITGVRRTTAAARLRAIFGNVNNVDAFTGMVAEAHLPGSDFGELQRTIWTRQFQALRDGDRYFYGNDMGLSWIRNTYGIDFRRNLGDIIALNTDIPRAEMAPNVFFTDGEVPPASCRAQYTITTQWPGNFQATVRITNTGSTPIPAGWTTRFAFANGQQITQLWDGVVAQDGPRVPVSDAGYNADIPPGASRTFGFNATRNDAAPNSPPTRFSLNTTVCSRG